MKNDTKIRVGLVDDQALVRTGFSMVINSQDDMEVVLEAGNGKTALERLSIVPVDVLLMDIRMPIMDGLEATAAVTSTSLSSGNQPKVLVLTTFEEDEYILGAVQAGASGFLVKDAPPDQLLDAIRTLHRGDAIIGPSSTRRLLTMLSSNSAHMGATNPDLLSVLTDREVEVLKFVAQGYTNGEIASLLHLAEATIKTHVGRIFYKLGARDRVQAVMYAYDAGLVRPGDVS